MDGEKLFAAARVARMATTNAEGTPHLVPVLFVFIDGTVFTSVDDKLRRTKASRRLDNIATNRQVSLLVDHYEEDWDNLWWVRADGDAEILDQHAAEAQHALETLSEKYPQYALIRPEGSMIAVRNLQWQSWSGKGTASVDEELG